MLKKIKQFLLKNTDFGKTRYLNYLYKYDLKQYYLNSCMNKSNPECIATKMRILVHAIEKGMSLPNCNPGFGKQKILSLIELYDKYSKIECKKDLQVLDLVKSIIASYAEFQQEKGVTIDFIPEKFLINSTNPTKTGTIEIKVKKSTSFKDIAYGRHSSRNFLDTPLPHNLIKEIISIAQTAPSACNRQATRIYACVNKGKIDQIFSMHGGIRGFSKPAVIFAITGDLALYLDEYERNAVFVDGGIYLMNLLYSIDSFGLASCPIIWGSEPSNDDKLSKISNIPKGEKIISLALAGYYPHHTYLAAASEKRDINTILNII